MVRMFKVTKGILFRTKWLFMPEKSRYMYLWRLTRAQEMHNSGY